MKQITFRRPEPVPLVFTLAALLLFITLGVWQLQRLGWKEEMLRRIDQAQAEATLTALPEDVTALPWRKVELSGSYDYTQTLHMLGRQSGGYYLLTPFKLADGRFVLVNRGWAVKEKADVTGPASLTITGILREPKLKRLFSPPNHPEKNLWFVEDITEMRQATGAPLLPAIIDATGPRSESGWPILNEGRIVLRNDHLGYALTWFALAGVAVVMFAAYHARVRSEDE